MDLETLLTVLSFLLNSFQLQYCHIQPGHTHSLCATKACPGLRITGIDKMHGLQRMPTSYPSSKTSTKARNDRKWETRKDDIRSVYIDMDHTLKETMKIMEDTYHFTAR